MNMLKIYPQGVDYGPLPFVLNNLGNLGSVKQSRHKLPLLSLPPTPSLKKEIKKCPFPKALIMFLKEKRFVYKIKVSRNLEDLIFQYFFAGYSVLILRVQLFSQKKFPCTIMCVPFL